MDIISIASPLYQWDTGRKVRIMPRDGTTVDAVNFHRPNEETALVVLPVVEDDGKITANIPNILLQSAQNLTVFAVMVSENGQKTICDRTFHVTKRQKPGDYVYEETEVYSIATALKQALQEAKDSGDFKGDPGEPGKPFTYEDFTPEQLEALKGKDGYTPQKGVDYVDGKDGYTPVKGVDYYTEAEKTELEEKIEKVVAVGGGEFPEGCKIQIVPGTVDVPIVNAVSSYGDTDREQIVQDVITALGTPVFGTINENNVVTLTGDLAPGNYTLEYEASDGSTTPIPGTLTVYG